MSVRYAMRAASIIALGLVLSGAAATARAAAPLPPPDGAKVYEQKCASCHNGQVARAPKLEFLKVRTPESVVDALQTGVMKFIGLGMPDGERKAVAEFITGKPFGHDNALKDTASNPCPQA